jgi:hypothetical protein
MAIAGSSVTKQSQFGTHLIGHERHQTVVSIYNKRAMTHGTLFPRLYAWSRL